jgi:hypothetical protein
VLFDADNHGRHRNAAQVRVKLSITGGSERALTTARRGFGKATCGPHGALNSIEPAKNERAAVSNHQGTQHNKKKQSPKQDSPTYWRRLRVAIDVVEHRFLLIEPRPHQLYGRIRFALQSRRNYERRGLETAPATSRRTIIAR